MARLYSNENFPLEMVLRLRQYGHDVMTSYEAKQANQGVSDSDVLAFATQQNRIVITLNRDDFLNLHRSKMNHAGIIICKEDRDYAGQATAVHEYLMKADDLQNCLVRFKRQNHRSRLNRDLSLRFILGNQRSRPAMTGINVRRQHPHTVEFTDNFQYFGRCRGWL